MKFFPHRMRADFWLKEREEFKNLLRNPAIKLKNLFG